MSYYSLGPFHFCFTKQTQREITSFFYSIYLQSKAVEKKKKQKTNNSNNNNKTRKTQQRTGVIESKINSILGSIPEQQELFHNHVSYWFHPFSKIKILIYRSLFIHYLPSRKPGKACLLPRPLNSVVHS